MNKTTTQHGLRSVHIAWGVLLLSAVFTFIPSLRDLGALLMPFSIGYIMGCADNAG